MSLILEHVSKSFAGTDRGEVTHALGNIDMEINEEEFITLVGPSGCGKSTILRLVAGLIRPTQGTVTLNGAKIQGTSPNRGMAFQKPTLFPWLNVEQNINFSLRMQKKMGEGKEKTDKMLKLVGLEEFKDAFPHHLSGGMAQRAALARVIINEPEVLLLDEPLGALDAFTRMSMQDEILGMWKSKKSIAIMVTHDVDEAIYMGTRVVVMAPRPGRIVENIKVDMEYPRNRNSKNFLQYRTHILEMLNFGKNEE